LTEDKLNQLTISTNERPRLELLVAGKRYVIQFSLHALISAEEKVGHSLRKPQDWFGAPAKDIPALLEAGLSKHHPEVTSAEVRAFCDTFNAEMCATVTEAFGAIAFPDFTAHVKTQLEAARLLSLEALGSGTGTAMEGVGD
jgi:hypothetical protein